MSIDKLIESIGLSTEELKKYLFEEIEEFIQANHEDEKEEFGDILFALKVLHFAKTEKHCDFNNYSFERKIKNRLHKYGTISKKTPIIPKVIDNMNFGVIHFCFGSFKAPWERFNPLKNGTEAEITELTELEIFEKNNYTNHLIITFDDVNEINVNILHASWRCSERNTIRIQIPDFIFKRSKKEVSFPETYELLSFQVISALQLVDIRDDAILHFHSWESGFIVDNEEFNKWVSTKKTLIFSPYLTVSRLKEFIEKDHSQIYTLNYELCKQAAYYELKLIERCENTVLESKSDYNHYSKSVNGNFILVSFTKKNNIKYIPRKNYDSQYNFVTGGRPVYEKGFLQLINNFKDISEWGTRNAMNFHLKIYCIDNKQNKDKYTNYLALLYTAIENNCLNNVVSLVQKVSETELEIDIEESSGLIIPSLFDPFCLMPKYAFFSNSPVFVSKHTGISENIKSLEYLFDPLEKDGLLKSIQVWIKENPLFHYKNENKPFTDLYLRSN